MTPETIAVVVSILNGLYSIWRHLTADQRYEDAAKRRNRS